MFYLQCLLRDCEPDHILAYRDEIEACFEDYTDLHYLLGLACYQSGDIGMAEKYFHDCLNLGVAPCHKYLTDPGTATYKVLKSLAALEAGRGNFAKSLKLYQEMLSYDRGLRPGLAGITSLFTGRGQAEDLAPFLKKHNLYRPGYLGIVARYLILEGKMERGLCLLRRGRELCEKEADLKQLLTEVETISGLEIS